MRRRFRCVREFKLAITPKPKVTADTATSAPNMITSEIERIKRKYRNMNKNRAIMKPKRLFKSGGQHTDPLEKRYRTIRKFNGANQLRHQNCRANPDSRAQTKRRHFNQQATESSKQTNYSCYGCDKLILDKYILGACDKFWHEDCLKCDHCNRKLGDLDPMFYEKLGMKLCRQDYQSLFGQRTVCSICNKLIFASEMVMRAKANVYHLECFACQLCGLRFCVGDRFYLCENKIVCQYDYEEHIVPIEKSLYPTMDPQRHHCQQPTFGPDFLPQPHFTAIERAHQPTTSTTMASNTYKFAATVMKMGTIEDGSPDERIDHFGAEEEQASNRLADEASHASGVVIEGPKEDPKKQESDTLELVVEENDMSKELIVEESDDAGV